MAPQLLFRFYLTSRINWRARTARWIRQCKKSRLRCATLPWRVMKVYQVMTNDVIGLLAQ